MENRKLIQDGSAVMRFRGEYAFLSNFYPAKVFYHGIAYLNAESAYQAQKLTDPSDRIRFAECYPDEAKRMGGKIPVRDDWEEVKCNVMEEIVRAKFEQNPRLAHLLLATGDMILYEGNTWQDVFWGVDLKTLQGENHLGRILMELRDSFRREGITDRSAVRPVRNLKLHPGIFLSDEHIEDISGACFVVECEDAGKTPLKPGEVVMLREGVIQTVCPIYGRDEERLLRSCYQSCLDMAMTQGTQKIAMPVLGTGKCCFPKRKAVQIAMESAVQWLAEHPAGCEVWFCPMDHRIFEYLLECDPAAC